MLLPNQSQQSKQRKERQLRRTFVHISPSFPASPRSGAAVRESRIRRSGSPGEGEQPSSGLEMLDEQRWICVPPPLQRNQRWQTGRRRALDARPCWQPPPPPECVWFTCHPTGICHLMDNGPRGRWEPSGPHLAVMWANGLLYPRIAPPFCPSLIGAIGLGPCHFQKTAGGGPI